MHVIIIEYVGSEELLENRSFSTTRIHLKKLCKLQDFEEKNRKLNFFNFFEKRLFVESYPWPFRQPCTLSQLSDNARNIQDLDNA